MFKIAQVFVASLVGAQNKEIKNIFLEKHLKM
jgi:hypothetical protein